MVLNIALAPPATSELGCGGRFSDDSQSFPGSGRTARRPGVPGWRRGATLLIRGERKSRFGHHNLDNIQSVRHPYLSHYYYIADCSSHPEARLQLRSLCVFRSSLQMFHIHVLTVSYHFLQFNPCVAKPDRATTSALPSELFASAWLQ